jgi:hypothetical protein
MMYSCRVGASITSNGAQPMENLRFPAWIFMSVGKRLVEETAPSVGPKRCKQNVWGE